MDYSWKLSLIHSWDKIASFAPALLTLLFIVILGFISAWVLKLVVKYVLKLIRFDVFGYRLGLTSVLTKASINRTPGETIGIIIYWCIVFFFFLIALGTLQISAADDFVVTVLNYIPRFLVAVFVFLVGYFLSRFFGRAILIGLVNTRVASAKLIATLFRILIIIFFSAMAIEQLGIARGIVIATFSISFGGVVLGSAIAFGLGGKEIAREILERRYKTSREEKPKPDEFSHL
jgi:hypothetical protein